MPRPCTVRRLIRRRSRRSVRAIAGDQSSRRGGPNPDTWPSLSRAERRRIIRCHRRARRALLRASRHRTSPRADSNATASTPGTCPLCGSARMQRRNLAKSESADPGHSAARANRRASAKASASRRGRRRGTAVGPAESMGRVQNHRQASSHTQRSSLHRRAPSRSTGSKMRAHRPTGRSSWIAFSSRPLSGRHYTSMASFPSGRRQSPSAPGAFVGHRSAGGGALLSGPNETPRRPSLFLSEARRGPQREA